MEPRLTLAGVAIWRTRLSEVEASVPGVLSFEEQERAARFVFPRDRERYVAGRTWLRRVLGEVTGRAPAALSIAYTRMGKPWLSTRPDVCFSLAHSGDEAVLAVAEGRQVGVDIEELRSTPIDLAAAGLVLSPAEVRLVAASDDRGRVLLRCWVRKEAYGKATGEGIDRYLADVTLTGDDGLPVPPPGWDLFDLADGPSVVAAVAVESTTRP